MPSTTPRWAEAPPNGSEGLPLQSLLFYLHVLLNSFLGLSLVFHLVLWYFAKDFRLLSSPEGSTASSQPASLHASEIKLETLPSKTAMA